jgi:hypothetical protein
MTDNIPKLDIAQRIAKTFSRTTELTMPTYVDLNPGEDSTIGEVPKHLRPLYVLLTEVSDEADAAEQRLREAKERCDALRAIFFAALKQHVPYDRDDYDGVKLCAHWRVAGFKRGDDSG